MRCIAPVSYTHLGTEVNMTLKPGGTLGRYGNIGEKSNFVTQTGAAASKLALPQNTNPAIYQEFEVIKEISGTIQAEIAPWGEMCIRDSPISPAPYLIHCF